MSDQRTASRATLDEGWKAARHQLDWMSVPHMANYVNKMVSKRDLHNRGHWAIYANETYVTPLAKKLGRPLSLVSLGSGAGHIERSLIEFGWPISELTGLEYDSELRRQAATNLESMSGVEANFRFFDFNAPLKESRKYDVVFTCHSIHHAEDLELLLRTMNELLNDDGLIIGIDFFGPTRFQIEYNVKPIIEELDHILPDILKRDLRFDDLPVRRTFHYDTIEDVRRADESESVRSSDLRTLLFSTFPIVEIAPMGGTLLRWLMQYRAGNFNHSDTLHVAVAQLLEFIERVLIENRVIRSDDLFFVLKKSERI